jgi:hypothetical protein
MNIPEDSKYVLISEIDRHSSNYELVLNQLVNINGQTKLAKEIKVGDSVSFLRNNETIRLHEIKSVWYSRFTISCFTGDCIIKTINGNILVKNLKVGTRIITTDGITAEVKCILKTEIYRKTKLMIHKITGLEITKWHPVLINNKWVFPCESKDFEEVEQFIDNIYSIGISSESSYMIINNIKVIGLGHGITNDPVAYHPYFGSNLVINDIFSISPDGYCVIKPSNIIRDDDSGLINGIRLENNNLTNELIIYNNQLKIKYNKLLEDYKKLSNIRYRGLIDIIQSRVN